MFSAAYRDEAGRRKAMAATSTAIQAKAAEVVRKLDERFRSARIPAAVRKCGNDRCIDLYIHFEVDRDVIKDPKERTALVSTGKTLKRALDDIFDRGELRDVALVVEGHSDSTQVRAAGDKRAEYLYNWNLSARRATSVLYEFRTLGLAPPRYNILAIGYSDSQPLCRTSDELCAAKNRRTTIRISVDSRAMQERTGIASE